MTTEPIPNLYPAVCPSCGVDAVIVYEQRALTTQTVAGFNEQGEIEYLPDDETTYDDDAYHCRDCGWEGDEKDLADATFAPEEGGDGSAPPF